jgi:TonB family protein
MAQMKEKMVSMAGTLIVHALLLVFLLLYYIKPNDKERFSADLGGVPVMFGNVADAGGDDEPFGRGNGLAENITEVIESDPAMPNNLNKKAEVTPASTPSPESTATKAKASKSAKEPVATQDMEKTIAANNERKAAADKKAKEESEAKRKAIAEAAQKQNINSQMAGLFGNGTGSGSRGNTQGNGTQGSPAGNGNTGKVSGVGGTGTYDLGGRGLGAGGLKLPSYHVDDYGTVVVDIIVNPQGDVIEATIGRGTNTTNTSLRNESLRAAKQTKFGSVNTSNNQKGTITYKFNLN